MKRTEINELQLINHLKIHKCISVAEAMERTDSSESTVRRLFKRLEDAGKCLRYYGGLRLHADLSTDTDYFYENVENKNIKAKLQIAETAAALIENKDVIYLDSGTTLARFAAKLTECLDKKMWGISIFTNSLVNLNLLKQYDVVLTGGNFRIDRNDFCGYVAEETLRSLHFTKCFLGTDGYSNERGFTTTDFSTARLNEIALANSDKSYVLMDSSKFFTASIVSYSKNTVPDCIITESRPNDFPEIDSIQIPILTAD